MCFRPLGRLWNSLVVRIGQTLTVMCSEVISCNSLRTANGIVSKLSLLFDRSCFSVFITLPNRIVSVVFLICESVTMFCFVLFSRWMVWMHWL